MLAALGLNDPAQLFREIPANLQNPAMELPPPLSELELMQEMKRLAGRNRPLSQWDCFLGAGVYSRFIPAVVGATIGRPEFYTAYTPYQAEASQGYLQTIFEFQSMVAELYDLPVANASMYDVATAAAEGALLASSNWRIAGQAPGDASDRDRRGMPSETARATATARPGGTALPTWRATLTMLWFAGNRKWSGNDWSRAASRTVIGRLAEG
jgi:hypothetical protein